MFRRTILLRAACGLAVALLAGGAARAAEIRVVSSGGFAAAYRALAPVFERETGHRLIAEWGPSMGHTPQAVPARLARGEPIDVVIMVGYALDALAEQGKVVPETRRALARAGTAVAVRAGARVPEIGTLDALRQTLLAASSIAYSDSASGVYVRDELFRKLGIAEAVGPKARMIPAEPVGAVVARGEAEIGFQQLSELKPIPGIAIAGLLPAEVQLYTVFSAGQVAGSREPEAARALIRFLASPEAAEAIRATGMEPLPAAP
ncbi:substrate-binding domain-containing protein [Methylobacterium sp. ID0610]|uniref:substrate-binding domain-containing protein n=1 Tax=Methylobacterium carpenticola TaxID=3344827 RepID=UPI0036A7BA01